MGGAEREWWHHERCSKVSEVVKTLECLLSFVSCGDAHGLNSGGNLRSSPAAAYPRLVLRLPAMAHAIGHGAEALRGELCRASRGGVHIWRIRYVLHT